MTWFLMLSHQKITNTAIQIYFQNELWLNGAYCRNRLSKISINKCQCITLNEYVNIKTHRLLVMLEIMLHVQILLKCHMSIVGHVPSEIK